MLLVVAIIAIAAGAGTYYASSSHTTKVSDSTSVIQVVAAENFWGSLASQLGGVHVHVLSIVSDPNADPHEYESNAVDAQAIANASLVIVNGAGYDAWALKLISADNTPHRTVLNVQELLGQSIGVNPHFWYSPYYVNDTVHAVYKDLINIDPKDKAYFTQQYATLNASLWQSYMKQEAYIMENYAGVPVASTESIFSYMANATGLDLVSPTAFMNAVSEGNDPPVQSVTQFEALLEGGNTSVRVLVYNEQTITPLAQTIKAMAAQYGIPTVGVTETIQPVNLTFQAWMQGEIANLSNALNAYTRGQ